MAVIQDGIIIGIRQSGSKAAALALSAVNAATNKLAGSTVTLGSTLAKVVPIQRDSATGAIKLGASSTVAASQVKLLSASLGKLSIVAGRAGLSKSLASFRSVLGSVYNSFTRLIKISAVFGAIIGALVLYKSIKEFTDFQFAMAKVQAVANATSEELRQLTALTRNLGATTVFTAKQSAEALLLLTQAGFSVSQSMRALPDTLSLAQAGFLEIPKATDIVISTLKGFGLEVDQVGRVTDVLAQTARNSKTTIESLGAAFSYAAPLSRALNVDIEQTSALLGVLGNRGLGDRSGRGLNAFFSQLSKGTPDAVKALARYGLTLEDVDIKTKGAIKVIKTLNAANISVRDNYKIFGRVGALVALSFKDVNEELDKLHLANLKAEGSTKKMQRTMNETNRGALKQFTSAISEAYIQIGQDLEPAFVDFSKTLTGAISIMNGMETQFYNNNKVSKELRGQIKELGGEFKNINLFLRLFFQTLLKNSGALIKFGTDVVTVIGEGLADVSLGILGIDKDIGNLKVDSDGSAVNKFALFFAKITTIGQEFRNRINFYLDVGGIRTLNNASKEADDKVKELRASLKTLQEGGGGFGEQIYENRSVEELTKQLEIAQENALKLTTQIHEKNISFTAEEAFKKSYDNFKSLIKKINQDQKANQIKLTVDTGNSVEELDKQLAEFERQFKAYQARYKVISDNIGEVLKGPGEQFAESLSEGLATGQVRLAEFLNKALQQILQASIKKAIVSPLVKIATGAIQTAVSSVFAGPAPSGADNVDGFTLPEIGSSNNQGFSTPNLLPTGAGSFDKLSPGAGSLQSSNQPVFNVFDQRTAEAPKLEQRKNSTGGIDTYIKESVDRSLNEGAFDNGFSSKYNLSTQGSI